jgi:hypothetical protein
VRWGNTGAGRGRGRGKGRSPRPEFGSSQQERTGDVSEEDGAKVAAVVDGTELETLEELERYCHEVSSATVIPCVDPRRNRATCVQ